MTDRLTRRDFLAVVGAATSAPVFLRGAAPDPVAVTTGGSVRGAINSAGVVAFRGVPFAASTAGPGRFRPPAPVPGWSGIRDTLAAGPIAPQNDDDRMGLLARYTQSEDCLNLNIWTPALDDTRRPVIVFMHGGGFTTGSGSLGLYDGSILARAHDVVVVTINYRLGIFGFPPFQLHGPEVSANLGLEDAIAALQWVKANIAAFGGDPDRVLQCGQSAGGMLSATMGVVPAARGLYQRAVPMSLQYLVTVDRDRQARYTAEILAALGIARGDLRRLADLPMAALLEAQGVVRAKGLAAANPEDQIRWPFMLNHDDIVLGEDPCVAIGKGRYRDVPTLVGATTEELMLSPAQERANPTARARLAKDVFLAGLRGQIGAGKTDAVWSAYRTEYPDKSDIDLAGLISTDQLYRIPAVRLAEAQGRHPGRAWAYQVGYRGTGPVFHGAHHAIDLPFWFGTIKYPPVAAIFLGHDATELELTLAAEMQRTLATFARSGMAEWPVYELRTRQTRMFDLESRTVADPRPATRKVWDGVVG